MTGGRFLLAVQLVSSLSTVAGAADRATCNGAGPAAGARPDAVAEIRTERPPAGSSSSPMPVSWTRLISCCSSRNSKPAATAAAGLRAGPFAVRSSLATALRDTLRALGTGEIRDQAAQREQVALDAKTLNRADGGAGDQGRVTERFPRMWIGHVHLDRR